MSVRRLALYTTVYPGVEPYLKQWYASVRAQSDRDFDLWIGVDALSRAAVEAAIGEPVRAVWVRADGQSTPARIRQAAAERMIEYYDAVVFADADDLLAPTRVASARQSLESADVTACALRVIDQAGRDLGITFGAGAAADFDGFLPRYNIFGLSNSSYRAQTLRKCLPIPAECQLIDWFLVTKAWAGGAALSFDERPRMYYRQYAANTARVLPGFTPEQVLRATQKVRGHYGHVIDVHPSWRRRNFRTALLTARERVETFHRSVTRADATLERYVAALNHITPRYVWWWAVAHPALEEIWKN